MRFAGDDSDKILLNYLLSEADIPNPNNDIAYNWPIKPSRGIGALTKEELRMLPNSEVGLPKHKELMENIDIPTFLKKAELDGLEVAGINPLLLGGQTVATQLFRPEPFADGTLFDPNTTDGGDPTMWTKSVRKSPESEVRVSYPDESFQNDDGYDAGDLVPWIWH